MNSKKKKSDLPPMGFPDDMIVPTPHSDPPQEEGSPEKEDAAIKALNKLASRLGKLREDVAEGLQKSIAQMQEDPQMIVSMIESRLRDSIMDGARRRVGISSYRGDEINSEGVLGVYIDRAVNTWLDKHIFPVVDKAITQYLKENQAAIMAYALKNVVGKIKNKLDWVSSSVIEERVEQLAIDILDKDSLSKVFGEFNYRMRKCRMERGSGEEY